MVVRRALTYVFSLLTIVAMLWGSASSALAQDPTPPPPTPEGGNPPPGFHGRVTPAERKAAAERAAIANANAAPRPQAVPGGMPDYFGTTPNYANSPQATFNATVAITDQAVPGGAGAQANVLVGGISGLTVSAGSGCFILPTAVITGGGGYGAAINIAPDGLGGITATVASSGYLYTSVPNITLTGGNCTVTPTVTALINPTGVTGIQLVFGGAGYISPTVSITSPTGVGASAIASASMGVINAITVTATGSGYGLFVDPVTGKPDAMRKFVDALPQLGLPGSVGNDLGQYLALGVPDTTTYPGSDYYEIGLVQYEQKLHADLPPTTLREYVQLQTNVITSSAPYSLANWVGGVAVPITRNGVQVMALAAPQYLGPTIVATKDRPVRIKFTNFLPTGAGGDLFIPVDTTYMGAGMGPTATVTAISLISAGSGYTTTPSVTLTGGCGGVGAAAEAILNPATGTLTQVRVTNPGNNYTCAPTVNIAGNATATAIIAPASMGMYTENRATLHLHGGNSPWISDGTPHQWTTPANETTPYPEGVSVYDVPDMGAPGDGSLTFFYTNQQSARLMFYHDHAYGITRLNVYAGEAAGYIIRDSAEITMTTGGVMAGTVISAGLIPTTEIPLVIQDKGFVDANTIPMQDPTWNWGTTPGTPHTGDLWFPHVYMPNQNPGDMMGANAVGRWDYGPWFWPPYTGLVNGPVPNPIPGEYAWNPGTPNPSGVPESFVDTPVINGTAYPYLDVLPQAYRFRILNAANDRYWNLSWFVAEDPLTPMYTLSGTVPMTLTNPASGEVHMVPAVQGPGMTWQWPDVLDSRAGGVPDPKAAGPSWLQIANESGWLPQLAVIPPQPVGYEYNRRNIVVLNVSFHGLFMGPAERADVIVDFSQFAGKTLILYNDSPAPVPAFDPRNDYYTNDGDQTSTGGAPNTLAGYGPNTRTIMQVRVAAAPVVTFTQQAALAAALPLAFQVAQPTTIVPQAPYAAAYSSLYPGQAFPTDTTAYVRIQDTTHTFTPLGQTTPITMDMVPKAIQELFSVDYGRMNATLGFEMPNTNIVNQTTIPTGYVDPPTEIIADTVPGTLIGQLGDGTQIWKITHNGVDTHAIHVHMYDAQLINRVGWDGMVKPPDPNEVGWKDTIRMNPLEDAIIALRHTKPTLPFELGNSYRTLDVTEAPGTALANQFTNVDLAGNPVTVVNDVTNYGWEYVWHCHLLGHEENDMMHTQSLVVAPNAPPSAFAVTVRPGPVARLTWNASPSLNVTNYTIVRATDAAFTQNVTTFVVDPVPGVLQTYNDAAVIGGVTFYYKIMASNIVGYTRTFAAPAVGFETLSADSAAIGPASVAIPLLGPTNLRVTRTTQNSVSLSWRRAPAGITGYEVWFSTNGATGWTLVATVGPNVTSFTQTGLARQTTYFYRVRAYLVSGTLTGFSGWSNTVSGTTR